MTYRDLPTMKISGPKHAVNMNFTKISTKNLANSLHTFRKWSITWSQFVVSGFFKCWLIRHSKASTAMYSSRKCGTIKHGELSLDSGSVKKTSHRCLLLYTKHCTTDERKI